MHTYICYISIDGAAGREARWPSPLLGLLALVFVIFTVVKPDEFATWANVSVTADQQAPVIIGGLAVLIPLLTDSIDLSVGANISLANILLAGLTTNDHLGVEVSVVLAIAASTVVGLANGLIVERLQVTSFVGTLGMATLLTGVGLAYCNSTDILTVIVGFALRYLPVGRKLRAAAPIRGRRR
jgi:ribose transport system permease protein